MTLAFSRQPSGSDRVPAGLPAPIPQAVILAAGEGSRLRAGAEAAPKPLTPVAGISLLERAILVCRDAGVTDIVVVVGYQREVLLPALAALRVRHRVRITPAISTHWRRGNGASVLAAEPYVHGPFFLMMCDHVVPSLFLTQLLDADDGARTCALAVDCLPERVPDLDEATKAQFDGDRIAIIGKTIAAYDAVDTGVFLCRPALFDALHTASNLGHHSLSEAVQLLAHRGDVGWVDSAGLPWIDVDNADDLRRAEELLTMRDEASPAEVLDPYALPDAASY